MNKKDFFYLVIIAGLIAFIISDQESDPTTDAQQPQQSEISITESGPATEISESIESTAQNTEADKYSASQNSEFHEDSDLPNSSSSEKPETKRTTANTSAALQKLSENRFTERFNEQRERKFVQAPPDAWGDDMRNEVETLYYSRVNQSGIERFNAKCKAKMCNIDLVLDENANKATFSNISINIFPSYPRQPNFVMTTISDNTITIKADFDAPITTDDN
ncbi:hypothetical protein [Idiomarina sp. HP20-50]|uniref:hypothetical protein n=1 Tax=Idiomarina sp. HP20-50 TaxID=3070813 RepID=UPI00294B141B|nr:hypothetical protein [Idiomarina sp. HP20-50]MDV6316513.1 hypothetical protein [Idiomarina sp. HP20-50]